MILGVENRGSLYPAVTKCHRVTVNELREIRRAAGLSQRQLADLVGVPVNTFRMWDSGLRSVPPRICQCAKDAVARHAHQHELLSLDRLASELGVHIRTLQAAARRTLQAAARTGRLDVAFDRRSVWGRPRRTASRAAAETFIGTHYRRFAGQRPCPAPLPDVPDDYADQLKRLRGELRLTQEAFAQRIGAAGKAVVYQWESRKRTPSPVFWEKIEQLAQTLGA